MGRCLHIHFRNKKIPHPERVLRSPTKVAKAEAALWRREAMLESLEEAHEVVGQVEDEVAAMIRKNMGISRMPQLRLVETGDK